jgi:hypothetical protein
VRRADNLKLLELSGPVQDSNEIPWPFIPLKRVPSSPLNRLVLGLDFDQFPFTLNTEKQLVISPHVSKIHSTTY